MAIKTVETNENVSDFINSFADSEQKKKDSFELLDFFQNLTGCEPKMWGTSIIGFGKYHYKSEKSKQEGDWFLTGFSPRKAALTLYANEGLTQHEHLLKNLGKFKTGMGCIYIKKLSDINLDELKILLSATIEYLKSKY
jgi:hypothetical protein